jgi:hypothetical protein
MPATGEFFYSHKETKDGLRSKCKPCWIASNKEDSEKSRDRHLQKTYGLTLDDFQARLVSQGGGCAICGATANPHGKSLCVDHDHRTGRVRGLLCDSCNKALGLLKDDIPTLRKAIGYLELH